MRIVASLAELAESLEPAREPSGDSTGARPLANPDGGAQVRDCPIAVVGATGFIGSRLVTRLRRTGHPVAGFNQAHPPVVDKRPAAGLGEAEVVFFLAARLSPQLAARRPDRVAAERALLLDVLDAVGRRGRRPAFVLASSGAVYAPQARTPYPESAPAGPTSAYGRAKLRLEQDLLGHAGRVRPVVLRLGNVYGPGQHTADGYGVLPHWLSAATRHEPVRLIGDPLAVRDYVHIDDVAELLELVCGRMAEVPTVLNVGSGVPTSLAALIAIVSEVVGRDLAVIRESGRAFDRQDTCLDPALAFSALGWRARTDLADGVRQCWDQVLATHSAVDAISRP